jgi:hypothetical protein
MRRGLLRLWVPLTVGWIAYVWWSYATKCTFTDAGPGQWRTGWPDFALECFGIPAAMGMSQGGPGVRHAFYSMPHVLFVLLAVPAALLALVFAVEWVIKGFRHQSTPGHSQDMAGGC